MDRLVLLVKIVLLLCTFGTAETNEFVKSGTLLSKAEASKECTNDGSRLVDYSEIQTTSEPQILPPLSNGESVWINGYAKFSSFLAEHGCLKTPKYRSNVSSHRLKKANLYSCLTKCLRDKQNFSYIGIENKYCVCFDDEDRKSVNNDFVDSSLCNIRCSNFAIVFCGGSEYINLYRIVDESHVSWANHQPLPRQCVYVQLRDENNRRRFSASSSSCFTADINGYICTIRLFSALNIDNCYSYTRNYCLVKKKATRQEAFNDCLNKNGALTEYFGEEISASLMAYNQRYWIGVFRTFQPTRNSNKGLACIAVRKASGKIYLEPDSCTSQKRYLCQRVNQTTSRVSGTVSDKLFWPPTLKAAEVSANNNILIRDNYTVLSITKAAVTLTRTSNVTILKQPTLSGAVPDKGASTTELVSKMSGSANHPSVIDKRVSEKGYSATINSPKTTLKPFLAARSETYKTESTSSDDKRVTLSSGRNTFSHLSTGSINANINTSNQNKNAVSVIVYILPSSLLLLGVIPVIIGFVIYTRKIKQQNKLKRCSHSNPSYSYVRSSDIDQNISTQCTESFHSNVYQNVERILNPKDRNLKTHNLQDDQYDKIDLVEIKPKMCVSTNQYDHALHVTENTYNNIEDTRPTVTCSIAKGITPFTSFIRSEVGIRSAVKQDPQNSVSHYMGTAYCNSVQTEKQHIYDKPFV